MRKLLLPSLLLSLGSLTMAGCWQDSCVARGTLINTPKGKRPIETLAVGDIIYSVNEATGEYIETKILHITSAFRECIAFCLPDGRRLLLTEDHIVYSPQRKSYLEAANWETDSEITEVAVLSGSGKMVPTPLRVETGVGHFQVFDLTVDSEEHNFIANDILVHNKLYQARCPSETTGRTVFDGAPCVCDDGDGGEYFCDYDFEGDRGSYGTCLCPPEWSEEGHVLDCNLTIPEPCSSGLCCPEGLVRADPISAELIELDRTCREVTDPEIVFCVSANTKRRLYLSSLRACYVSEEELAFLPPFHLRCQQFIDGSFEWQACDAELEERLWAERNIEVLPFCEGEEPE